MAFDKTPSVWLGAGYSLGTNQAKFTTADGGTPAAPQLTDAEAHATTGDIRKIFFALCMMMWAAWLAVTSANRPSRMTLQKQTVTDDTTGLQTVVFSFTFINEVSVQEVADEPA